MKIKEEYNKKLKNTKGITLIALVVTIIILLIMAGVSIGLVFDSNGLFAKANDAATKYNQSKQDEEDYLSSVMSEFDKYNRIYGGGGNGTLTPTETATPTPELTPTGTLTPTPEPTPTLPPKGEEPPTEGWTVEQAKGLVKRDGLKAHLGEKVQYSPEGKGTWRIFYYDNEVNSKDPSKGYFGDPLKTLYLKRDYEYMNTSLSDYTSHTPSDGGATMKKMNPKWAEATNGSSIDLAGEHCVAWLCDPKEWINYKVENVANYVIGSPTVEMYMKAYNVYKDNNPNSTTLINKIGNINGYSVGSQNKYGSSEYFTAQGSIEAGPYEIFCPMSNSYLWLASPSSYLYVICVNGMSGHQLDCDYFSSEKGVCPIVSIKSVVSY